MVCKRQEQCVFGEKCIYHIGSVLPKCSIFEQKPPIKQTEEEYIQTCTTEQLAEKLTDFSFWLVVTIPTEDRREKVRKRIVEWLKQPHTNKE
jgi:hypothetical protein